MRNLCLLAFILLAGCSQKPPVKSSPLPPPPQPVMRAPEYESLIMEQKVQRKKLEIIERDLEDLQESLEGLEEEL